MRTLQKLPTHEKERRCAAQGQHNDKLYVVAVAVIPPQAAQVANETSTTACTRRMPMRLVAVLLAIVPETTAGVVPLTVQFVAPVAAPPKTASSWISMPVFSPAASQQGHQRSY